MFYLGKDDFISGTCKLMSFRMEIKVMFFDTISANKVHISLKKTFDIVLRANCNEVFLPERELTAMQSFFQNAS